MARRNDPNDPEYDPLAPQEPADEGDDQRFDPLAPSPYSPLPGGDTNPFETGPVVQPLPRMTDGTEETRPEGLDLTGPSEGNDQRFDLNDPLGPPAGGVLTGDVVSHEQPSNWTPVAGYEGDVQSGKGYANLPGFDFTKLSTGGGSAGKYTPAARLFSQAIQGLGANDPSGLARALAYVRNNGFPQATQVSGDRIDFGDGNGPIDVITDSGSQNAGWWFQNGPDRAGGGGPAATAIGQRGAQPIDANADNGYRYDNAGNLVDAFGAPVAGGAGGGAPSAPAIAAAPAVATAPAAAAAPAAQAVTAPAAPAIDTTPQANPFNDRLRQMLLDQLSSVGGETVDANNPQVKGSIDAYNVQRQRSLEQERSAMAERNYATGTLDSGGYDTEVRGAMERAGTDQAGNSGSMVWQAAQAKRAQLSDLLGKASAFGLADQAQQIQRQIAMIDASLRQQGLTQQNAQFNAQLGQQDRQFTAGQGQQDRQFNAQLGQQNTQFTAGQNQQSQEYYDQLAYQYAQMMAGLNRDTLLAGM